MTGKFLVQCVNSKTKYQAIFHHDSIRKTMIKGLIQNNVDYHKYYILTFLKKKITDLQ